MFVHCQRDNSWNVRDIVLNFYVSKIPSKTSASSKMTAFRCTGRSRGGVRTYILCWTTLDPPLRRVGRGWWYNVADVLNSLRLHQHCIAVCIEALADNVTKAKSSKDNCIFSAYVLYTAFMAYITSVSLTRIFACYIPQSCGIAYRKQVYFVSPRCRISSGL